MLFRYSVDFTNPFVDFYAVSTKWGFIYARNKDDAWNRLADEYGEDFISAEVIKA